MLVGQRVYKEDGGCWIGVILYKRLVDNINLVMKKRDARQQGIDVPYVEYNMTCKYATTLHSHTTPEKAKKTKQKTNRKTYLFFR